MPAGHPPLDNDDPMFFSLERFSSVPIGYKSTGRCDIAFSGIYRSEITPNNGSFTGFGYGTAAVGGVMVLDTPQTQTRLGLIFYAVISACIPGEKLRIDVEVMLSNRENCLSKAEKNGDDKESWWMAITLLSLKKQEKDTCFPENQPSDQPGCCSNFVIMIF